MQIVEAWYKNNAQLIYPIWRNVFIAQSPNEATGDSLRDALQWFLRGVGYLHRNDTTLLFASARPYDQAAITPNNVQGVHILPQLAFPAGMRAVETPCPEWFGLAATLEPVTGDKARHWFFSSLNEEDIISGIRGSYYLHDQAAFEDLIQSGFYGMLENGSWELLVNQDDFGRDKVGGITVVGNLAGAYVVQAKQRHNSRLKAFTGGEEMFNQISMQVPEMIFCEMELRRQKGIGSDFNPTTVKDFQSHAQDCALDLITRGIGFLENDPSGGGSETKKPVQRFGVDSHTMLMLLKAGKQQIEEEQPPYKPFDSPPYVWEVDNNEYYWNSDVEEMLRYTEQLSRLVVNVVSYDWLSHLTALEQDEA